MNLKNYLRAIETLNPELIDRLPCWIKELKEIAKEAEQEKEK